MKKNERLKQIMDVLNSSKYISNQDLSKILYVSLPTIRRDLSILQNSGLIVRSHGGAKLIDGTPGPFDFRHTYKTSLKKELCKKAAELINDGDVIFIDSSSTAISIAEFITAKNVTAVTNGLPAAEALRNHNIKTFVAGGELLNSSQCLIGTYVESFLSNFNFDIVFFSSNGINQQGMIVDSEVYESRVRQVALKNCKCSVYLCDRDKINVNAPFNIINKNEISTIIVSD